MELQKQFVHNWYLPCCQFMETCCHVSFIQNNTYWCLITDLLSIRPLETNYSIPAKLPWIFPGAPLKINGASGNIQGNLMDMLQWNQNQNTQIFYQEDTLENDSYLFSFTILLWFCRQHYGFVCWLEFYRSLFLRIYLTGNRNCSIGLGSGSVPNRYEPSRGPMKHQ